MKNLFPNLIFLLIALSSFFITTSYAQKTNTKQSVSFYLNYLQSFDEVSSTTGTGQNKRVISLNNSPKLYLGFSFSRENAKNWFNEYSIIGLDHRKEETTIFNYMEDLIDPISGDIQHTTDLILRWEKGKYFIQNKDNTLNIGCSAGVSSQFYYSKQQPLVSNLFPFRVFRISSALSIAPRLKVNIKERLAIEIKIPLEFMTLTWENTYSDDPAQSLNERRKDYTIFDLGVLPQINLGISLNL